MIWFINSISVTILCIFCAGVVIPQILLIAFRKKLFDTPDERKIHQGAVPRLGGIAFKPVMFFSIAILAGSNILFGHYEMAVEFQKNDTTLFFCYAAIQLLYLIGMADDLVGVRYRAKFVVQILCGILLVAGGIWVNDLHGVLWIHQIPAWIGYPLTILLVVFIINAINLIDGIDGLASGLCGIACLCFGIIFFTIHQYIFAIIAFASFGVLIPFFYYNVFGNPKKHKKIFMGDTGSLTVGVILCMLSIKLVTCDSQFAEFSINPMVVAFSPLLIPCCDVIRVYLHRVRNGNNPFLPDKNHIHHKLLAIGMKQRTAMITIVALSVIFTLLNSLLAYLKINVNSIFAADIIIWTIANIILSKIKNNIYKL